MAIDIHAREQAGVSGDGKRTDAVPPFANPEVSGKVRAPACFRTGLAGSGKSYYVLEQIKANPNWGILSSTTGISAINIGAVTLNSLLGYFDTESLSGIQKAGKLLNKLREIKSQYQWLVIDEVSMMDGNQLTIITEEADRCGLGIYLTGDACQLPPVRAPWFFESSVWPRFEANTTRLTKVWRQTEETFLQCLNHARAGQGEAAAAILEGKWHPKLADDFDGTTLISKNSEVDAYNQRRLDILPGKSFQLTGRRWGKQRGEWKNIPERLELKLGAYVALLSNQYDEISGDLVYANGDCGRIVDFSDPRFGLKVRLVRSDIIVSVFPLLREVSHPHRPNPWFKPFYGDGGWLAKPHWQPSKNKFVEGQIEYYPIRLAWASTIHKVQGLSLDRIQFNFMDSFCGQPAMLYTGMSRCRTMGGLRMVGDRETFIRNCNVHPKVKRWL